MFFSSKSISQEHLKKKGFTEDELHGNDWFQASNHSAVQLIKEWKQERDRSYRNIRIIWQQQNPKDETLEKKIFFDMH